ncbi:MAG: gliding motility protein GldM, partial [Muribaculaceae bacterium]|nr:gliding motility protein GldM [Muribaculaceae bacterium]
MAQNQRQTPRQKMINLMYIVLTAMLALNVSSDVLDGFTEVEQSVSRSTDNSATRNEALMASLSGFASHNEKKGGAWHSKATIVKNRADSLDRMIEALKLEIVAEADGPGGNPKDIKSREDLDAA